MTRDREFVHVAATLQIDGRTRSCNVPHTLQRPASRRSHSCRKGTRQAKDGGQAPSENAGADARCGAGGKGDRESGEGGKSGRSRGGEVSRLKAVPFSELRDVESRNRRTPRGQRAIAGNAAWQIGHCRDTWERIFYKLWKRKTEAGFESPPLRQCSSRPVCNQPDPFIKLLIS